MTDKWWTEEAFQAGLEAAIASDSGPVGSQLFATHAREFGEGYAKTLRAALAAMPRPDDALREALKPTLFWDDTDPERGYTDPWEIVDQSPRGKVVAVRLGAEFGVRYFASLPPADDADSDDDWTVEGDDAEAVETMVKVELARRAALANGEAL